MMIEENWSIAFRSNDILNATIFSSWRKLRKYSLSSMLDSSAKDCVQNAQV